MKTFLAIAFYVSSKMLSARTSGLGTIDSTSFYFLCQSKRAFGPISACAAVFSRSPTDPKAKVYCDNTWSKFFMSSKNRFSMFSLLRDRGTEAGWYELWIESSCESSLIAVRS